MLTLLIRKNYKNIKLGATSLNPNAIYVPRLLIQSSSIPLLEPRMAGIVGIFASIGDHIPILNKEKFCQPQPEGK